jgi:hypothetical protein
MRLLDFSQEKADQFVQIYAADFLLDEELLSYSYHPRGQFHSEQDSINSYSVFPEETKIRLICFSDSCELSEPFNRSPLTLQKGTYVLKRDSIISQENYESPTRKFHSFEINPEDYFSILKKRLEKYGVFAYSRSTDHSSVKVYVSVQYYLICSKEVEKEIHNDKILKSYGNNWYFVKMERQMDLG